MCDCGSWLTTPLAVSAGRCRNCLVKAESLHIETRERLCKEFGGEFIRVKDYEKAKAIAEVARAYHVTQIVIGESQRSHWKLLLRGSLTQKLLRSLKNIDVHIIATEKQS
ncbi:universal stress protein [Cyanobacteria bacterium FACHB-63]|nr:universal stress protein [Cyanobacteria bacterium FACHB-63]